MFQKTDIDLLDTISINAETEVSGLTYIPEFISKSEEAALINQLDSQPWLTEIKRRVQHYGYKYDYSARKIDASMRLGAIPNWLNGWSEHMQKNGLFAELPDQVIVNEYLPGQGIAPHIDCVPCFEENIASLSLGSPTVMDFISVETAEKTSLLLEPRSIIILSGEARYQWRHGIAARKTDNYRHQRIRRERRISLTFRNVINE